MFTVLIVSLMLAGILVGFFVFAKLTGRRPFQILGITQKTGTVALLFVMGVWLGGNDAFWDDISTIGLRGLLFAVATIAASVAAVHFTAKALFRKKEEA